MTQTPDPHSSSMGTPGVPPRPVFPTKRPRKPLSPGRIGAMLVGSVAAIVVLVMLVIALSSFVKTQGGEIAVIRNGGPLDNNKVRQVVQPASARTYTGLFSSAHRYPAAQRFYTITADANRGDRAGVDVEQVPTADGVEVGIEATVYFTLTSDPGAISTFDDRYGTRKYRGLDGHYRYAWEGEEGWLTFLDQIIRPVISNDLRQQIGAFQCSELQSSCALVQSGAQAAANPGQVASNIFDGSVGKQNNLNLAKIQDSIDTSLAADLDLTLGGKFITGVRFNLAKITLPGKVQAAIDDAQAEFAAVSKSQARVAQAQNEARANEQRQKGYQQCPACATIDTLKAIPPTVTTFAPGAGFAITPQSGAAAPLPAR